MLLKLILVTILFSSTICVDNTITDEIVKKRNDLIKKIIYNAAEITHTKCKDEKDQSTCPTITDNCYKKIKSKYTIYYEDDETETPEKTEQVKISDAFIFKTIADSAKNPNDLGSYNDCLRINYQDYADGTKEGDIVKEMTYYLVQVTTDTKANIDLSDNESSSFLFGACLIKEECSERDIEILLDNINYSLYEILGTANKSQFKVIDVMKNNSIPRLQADYFASLIPFYFFLVMIIFNFLPIVPLCMLKCCFRKKEPVQEQNSKISSSFEDTIEARKRTDSIYKILYYRFKKAFSFYENFEEVMTIANQKFSPPGISHMRGLRSLAMILTTLGITFFVLMNSPLKLYTEERFINLMNKYFFNLIHLGVRFAPRLLYAYSGYLLVYKLFYYLDEEMDKETTSLKEERKSITSKRSNQSSLKDKEVHDLFNSEEENIKVAKWSIFFTFFMLKTHRFFIFVWTLLYFSFSLYYAVGLLSWDVAPMWTFLKSQTIDEFKTHKLWQSIILISTISNYKDWNPFSIAINEIMFFVLFSFLLFLCYRNKLRLDIFLLGLFALFFGLKIGMYFTMSKTHSVESGDPDQLRIYNTLFYIDDINAFLLNHPISNISCYVIGIYFGLINYVYQKSIDDSYIRSTGMSFLYHFASLHNFFQSHKTIMFNLFGFLCIVIILLCSSWFTIALNLSTSAQEFMKGKANIVMLFDVELFVIFILILVYIMTCSSGLTLNFLSSNYWSLISKTYFIFLLNITSIIYFVFYQSESRIKIAAFNVLFFFLFIVIVCVSINLTLYIMIEMPLKKLSNLLLESDSKKDDENVNDLNLEEEVRNIS